MSMTSLDTMELLPYVNDKFEAGDLIVNAGLRYEAINQLILILKIGTIPTIVITKLLILSILNMDIRTCLLKPTYFQGLV